MGRTKRFSGAGAGAVAVACFFALVVVASPVSARPRSLGALKARAKAVLSEIDRYDQNLEIAIEEYNHAEEELAQTRAGIEEATVDLTRSKRVLTHSRRVFSRRLDSIYRNGKVSFVEVFFGAKSFDEFLTRLDLLRRIGDQDGRIVSAIKAHKRQVEHRRADLKAQEVRQAAMKRRVEAHKADIEERLAYRRKMLRGLKKDIKKEIARIKAIEAARQAALERQVSADVAQQISVSTGGQRSDVVRIALTQLGKPYQYGAAGPDSFDCSGLTMWCYAQVGVSLPHYSGDQYNSGTHVARDRLQPGDLVFFGNPIHHVGMYVGGGSFIHAPHTGDVVKISSLGDRWDYVGATRP